MLLTTVPTLVVLKTPSMFSSYPPSLILCRKLALALNSLDAGDVLLDSLDPCGIVKLIYGKLEAKIKELSFEFGQLSFKLCLRQIFDFQSLH